MDALKFDRPNIGLYEHLEPSSVYMFICFDINNRQKYLEHIKTQGQILKTFKHLLLFLITYFHLCIILSLSLSTAKHIPSKIIHNSLYTYKTSPFLKKKFGYKRFAIHLYINS